MGKAVRKMLVIAMAFCISVAYMPFAGAADNSLAGSGITQVYADSSDSTDLSGTNIRSTDVTEPSDGNMLVMIDGRFVLEPKDTVLEYINEIRLEACQNGVPDPRNSSNNLTEDDYVPIKWSSDLEWIAQTRSAEASLRMSHTRPNGYRCFTATHNGEQSWAENLSWNSSNIGSVKSVDLMYGIEQWYGEMEYWVNGNTSKETGHYESLINPNYKYVGIGAFRAESIYYGCVAGEFSNESGLDEEQAGASGQYSQIIEIDASTFGTSGSTDQIEIYEGHETNLTADFTSTYQNTTCPYVTDSYITAKVTPIADVSWSSADESIATVDDSGLLKGISPGTTTITASCSGIECNFDIVINKYDPREVNTDDDDADIDGEYTFTGDGDWYGYTSYLNYEPPKATVLGRIYMVTLPEDGKLQIELSSEKKIDIEASIYLTEGDCSNVKSWVSGSSDEAPSMDETSPFLKKGTYKVIFSYTLEGSDYPGETYFYHKITFHACEDDSGSGDDSGGSGSSSDVDDDEDDISTHSVSVTAEAGTTFTYNGKVKDPDIQVYDNDDDLMLTEDEDYEITYNSDRKSVGKHLATVTFLGDYSAKDPVSIVYCIYPGKASFKSVKAGKKKVTVKINAQSGTVKYKIAYRLKGSKTWKYKTVSKASATISKLKSKKKYQIKVRAFSTVNGKVRYGSWSKVKTVKVL